MSGYVASLDANAKARYTKKLTQVGLNLRDDPYLPENAKKFVNDVSTWPKIEYGHIFAYFIARPGIYTQEQLISWKQLDAYNFFQSGYVRTVLGYRFRHEGRDMVILKANVNPSQRSPDEVRVAWIISKADGEIISTHCTCMAGLGEGCSHVAGVMFKVECAVRLGHTSITAEACKWNDVYCKKIEPSLIADIEFQRPKRGRDVCNQTIEREPKRTPMTIYSSVQLSNFYNGIKTIAPSAVVLSSIAPLTLEQSAASKPPKKRVVRKLPPLLTSLQDHKFTKMTLDELTKASEEVFKGMKVTSEEAEYLEESTRIQSYSPVWSQQRLGRITASNFRKVCMANLEKPPKSLLKMLLHEQTFDRSKVPSLQWGVSHEEEARQEYVEMAETEHVNFECRSSGLHVNPSSPHLGATPDGIISCECCGEGVIEIKCPYKHRDTHPHDIDDPRFF